MEPYQIGPQQSFQYCLPPGEQPEYLERRERDMLKVPDGDERHLFPHHGRYQGELVIMDPDDIIRLGNLQHRVGKPLVDGYISIPVVITVTGIRWKIMIKRPKRFIGKSFIEFIYFGGCEINRQKMLPG